MGDYWYFWALLVFVILLSIVYWRAEVIFDREKPAEKKGPQIH